MFKKKNILITGGAGFIGSHLIRHFIKKYPNYNIINIDSLNYSGNLENLKDIENNPNYTFIKCDIRSRKLLCKIFRKYKPEVIFHLAAETHVDHSINFPENFIYTNIIGTFNLLKEALSIWKNNYINKLFYHISTDEVFGTLESVGFFNEKTRYDPKSPYSASKASSDHIVRSFGNTYKIPFIISNCSNNYGPNQFPEKLIPLFIYNIKNYKSIPIYGDGNYIRDWIYIKDHIDSIDIISHKGKIGESYNIGGNNEWSNIDLAFLICEKMDKKLKRKKGDSKKLIQFVKNRSGHDYRYAMDISKMNKVFNWKPSILFEEGLNITIDWYLKNEKWLENIFSGIYKNYYQKYYKNL